MKQTYFYTYTSVFTYDCGVHPIAKPTKPLKNKIHIKLCAIALSSP